MERYVRAELGLSTDDDDEPDVMEDLALYHPLPYALSTWAVEQKHGILPEQGGVNDQSAAWWHDRSQLNRLYNITFDRLLPELEAGNGRRKLQTEDDGGADSWAWEDIVNG